MKILLTTLNCKYIHPNLALRWLYVSRDKRHDTSIKEYVIKDDLNKVTEEIVSSHPDVIGFSVYIWNIKETKELILKIHEQLPSTRIIVGGPEVSYECEDWLTYPIQCVLRGEGEITFWQAVNQEKDIDGYYSREYISPVAYSHVELEYLESLESPYFLPFDLASMKNRYFYFETSRGCPYKCSYCLSSLEKNVRLFSVPYIFKQLKQLEEHPVKQVKFLDRTFNVYPNRALEIAHFIHELKIDCSFQFEIAIDSLSEELMDFFTNVDTNKYRFEIGVQSFNPLTIQAVDRTQNFDRLVKNVNRLKEAGCVMHLDLIGGLPFEDIHSFEDSFHKLFALHGTEIQVGILKLLKGTKLRHQDSYEIEYDSQAPYAVKKTKWCSEEDLNVIENVYHATESLYNNNRARTTLDTLFSFGYNIFSILNYCGNKFKEYSNIQVWDTFTLLYEAACKDKGRDNELFRPLNRNSLQALLLTDYYAFFKQKPKRLFMDYVVSKNEVKRMYQNMIRLGVNEHILYEYSTIEYGYHDGHCMLQLVTYNKEHTLPTITWLERDTMEIFIATGNAHKMEEFKTMLEPLGYSVKSLKDLPREIDIEETGSTFKENAIIKAEAISKEFGIACIADDSGLEVDAMNKEPGVLSARYLGKDTSYDIKNQTIIDRVKDAKDRTCRYVCAIAYAAPNQETVVFEETVEGTVANKPEGTLGFGYDPIFFYPPFGTTLANVSEEKKNSISHRGKAIQRVLEYFNEKK